MAACIRAYCDSVHSALVEANGDWGDVTVTQALESADTAYLKKCLGDNHQTTDRTKVVTCIQNFRHRLRDEYTHMFGKDDAGLAEFLLTETDLPLTEQAAFLEMSQSRRLKAVKIAPYRVLPDSCWGGATWRALGCSSDISKERTALRQNQRREVYPTVYDPVGLHTRIGKVTTDLLSTLECPMLSDFEGNLQARRLLARLLAMSLYGMGCARFTDITPGLASKIGGERANNIDQVFELHAGCVRFMHVSKTGCERARWRICLFDTALCVRITTFLRSRFDEIAALTIQCPNWIQRALQTRNGYYRAWEDVHPERYAVVPASFHCTPYCFKHLGLSLLPSLFHVTSVLAVRTDIFACQCGHTDRTSINSYGVFDVCQEQYTMPRKSVQLSASGLFVGDRPVVPTACAEIVSRGGKKRKSDDATDCR